MQINQQCRGHFQPVLNKHLQHLTNRLGMNVSNRYGIYTSKDLKIWTPGKDKPWPMSARCRSLSILAHRSLDPNQYLGRKIGWERKECSSSEPDGTRHFIVGLRPDCLTQPTVEGQLVDTISLHRAQAAIKRLEPDRVFGVSGHQNKFVGFTRKATNSRRFRRRRSGTKYPERMCYYIIRSVFDPSGAARRGGL